MNKKINSSKIIKNNNNNQESEEESENFKNEIKIKIDDTNTSKKTEYQKEKINLNDESSSFLQNNNQEIETIEYYKIITFKKAYKYFWNQNYSIEQKKIKLHYNNQNKSFFSLLCSCCKKHKKIPSEFFNDYIKILCISKLEYNDNKPFHFNLLYTIYNFLTSSTDCKKIGNHWEKIGFQSENPSQDFRSVGMLNLFQTIAFIYYYPDIMKKFYDYINKQKCNWLFMSILINLTRISLNLLNEDKLINYIINKNSIVKGINDIFFGMVFYFFEKIQKEKKLTAEYVSKIINLISISSKNNVNLFYFKLNQIDKEKNDKTNNQNNNINKL